MNDPRLTQAPPLPPIDLNPRRDPPLDFRDAPYGELAAADYAELGFLCGLEVHQQLATRSKLFCRCPAGRRVRAVDAEVLRHMRPTLSELGEYDGCALMEFKTRKEIVYQLSRTSVCTYEMDDTPPFEIDDDAVRIALGISGLFNLKLVSELHVMRKQYLDGSIPTGFQRTAMVGIGGSIPFRASELGADSELRIRQLSLEEDSCREVSDIGHTITFRTDRLGTPLIETVTEPDLRTPRDSAAGVRLLASVARAWGRVLRGSGAARQDVNVSIAGSRRVEIKGVPSWRRLPRLVHNEAFRHLNLLRIKAALEADGIARRAFDCPLQGLPWEVSDLVVDAAPVLRRCEFAPIRDAIASGDSVCAIKLAGFQRLLGHRTQPGITFAKEIEDRVRVIACLTARPFMISSHLADYGLVASEWRQARSALRAGADDAVVLVWGPPHDLATAAREVLARAQETLTGVPSETRQSFPDGTTGFERILPGPERMYPDTDTPPLPIRDEWVLEIEKARPELPWERAARYEAAGLSAGAAARLAEAPWNDLFDALAPADSATAGRIAAALEKRLPHYWRETATRETPAAARIAPLVRALEAGRLHPSGTEAVLDRLLRQECDAATVLAEHALGTSDAAAVIAETVELGTALDMPPAAAERWALGRIMSRVPRGSVDPAALRRELATARRSKEGAL